MKIFLAQQNYHIGNFKKNVAKIINAINTAKAAGGDLVVFSELCICGYPANDLLLQRNFIEQCKTAVDEVVAHTKDIAVIVGAPIYSSTAMGKSLFNAAFFIEDCEIKQIIHKTCLPDYDVFDERRYFDPAVSWDIIPFRNKKIAVTICEDIWCVEPNFNYPYCPLDRLKPLGPDVVINLSASPFDYLHTTKRMGVVKANALKYELPILYCNTTGAQTDLVFDGGSMGMDSNGALCGLLKYFEEDLSCFTLNDNGSLSCENFSNRKQTAAISEECTHFNPEYKIELVYNALVLGIRDYFEKMGFQKAIIGSSGGIDSAVVLALACEALGKDNVVAVMMPSEYSTDHSIKDAKQLNENLQNPNYTIPINDIYETFLKTLIPFFDNLPFNVTEENLQSRIRGNTLMAIANKFNYILLNTSNKSELCTGYGTLYGDMAGGLSVLGDCYKQQVYALAKFMNRNKEVIPLHIISKPPSAELRPGQKDTDSLPDYSLLDKILFGYIEQHKTAAQIKVSECAADVVDRVLKMVNRNEYKRAQFCPIIRISPKAFGIGRRMPVVAFNAL